MAFNFHRSSPITNPIATMGRYLRFIPSNASLLAAYSSISTSLLLLKTAYSQVVPERLHDYLVSKIGAFFQYRPNLAYIIIDDLWADFGRNELFQAAGVYLSTKIGSGNRTIRVGKLEHEKNLRSAMIEGESVIDSYQGIEIAWVLVQDTQKITTHPMISSQGVHKTRYLLSFEDKYKEIVKNNYLVHVLNTYKSIAQEEKVLQLYYRGDDYANKIWKSIDFHHPATFDTMALDPELKKAIIDDLDRFLARKEFCKRVGRAWKRGYLLYGPPGTGKSSLIAAMANYLKFDVYNLELSSVPSDWELRKMLLRTTNRSMLVIEDVDCSRVVHDRSKITEESQLKMIKYRQTFNLSTLLNCIDGIWSSCGEGRVIVLTNNHKEVLDPALLRPGRMDMHIHLSYCTPQGFRALALNYLGIHDHRLFEEIDGLLASTNVTTASLAGELMKSDDNDVALGEVVNFLKRKKMEGDNQIEEGNGENAEE